MDPISLSLIAVLVAGLALLGLWSMWSRLRQWWIFRVRMRRAEALERKAAWVLRRAGYRVLRSQAKHRWCVYVDGQPVNIDICADYVVSRGLKRYVAEVKTGAVAPRITHGPTRRQLIEYQLAYKVHGVLLVDMERESIERFDAPLRPPGRAKVLLLGTLLGALGMYAHTTRWLAKAWDALLKVVDHF